MNTDVNPPAKAVSPQTVAALRGVGLAVLSAAILAAITAFSDLKGGQMATIAPFILLTLRTVEGFVDKARGQAPQAGVLGSAPADPNAYTGA